MDAIEGIHHIVSQTLDGSGNQYTQELAVGYFYTQKTWLWSSICFMLLFYILNQNKRAAKDLR